MSAAHSRQDHGTFPYSSVARNLCQRLFNDSPRIGDRVEVKHFYFKISKLFTCIKLSDSQPTKFIPPSPPHSSSSPSFRSFAHRCPLQEPRAAQAPAHERRVGVSLGLPHVPSRAPLRCLRGDERGEARVYIDLCSGGGRGRRRGFGWLLWQFSQISSPIYRLKSQFTA